MSAAEKKNETSAFTIPANHPWQNLWKVFAGVAVAGLAMAGAGAGGDLKRFAHSYLVAFIWGLTIALGCLFFVLVQHVTNAGWSVVVRRVAEQGMGALPAFAVLFLPIVGLKDHLYGSWMDHARAEADHAIHAKTGYLNFNFWIIRAVFCFAIWTLLSMRLSKLSLEQDKTKDPELTNRMVATSAPGIPLFALTLTLGSIDWVMSLEPKWYSTMFGVYLFAGAVVSMFAMMNLVLSRADAAGLLKNSVTVEHFHDLGKFMFAFVFFWGYIAFSQYMLYWYANIPEETEFFLHRGEHGWDLPSWILVFGHFAIPFLLMLSRHAKRTFPAIRQTVAAWILVVHFLDIYWLVMPNVDKHFHFNPLQDIGAWLFIAGVLFAVFFRRLVSAPFIPTGDPRLNRSLRFQNA
jgi:hypothetical protein